MKSDYEKEKSKNANENFVDEYQTHWLEKERKDQKQKFEELQRDISRQETLRQVRTQHAMLAEEGLFSAFRSQSHLEAIKKIIVEFESLEKQIKDVQQKKVKVDYLASLRRALGRELDLENQWYNYVRHPSTSNLAEDSRKGHFSNDIRGLPIFYGNHRLQLGEIRLLTLWPAPEAYYPLLCTLKTSKWKDNPKPKYAALSYFWGPDACNGNLYLVRDCPKEDTWGYAAEHAIRIPIRNNLFRALLRLRSRKRPVALWVDAVCINQGDLEEKTIQLQRMADVYSNAKNVCVWLGESDTDGRSDKAMEFITEIMDFAVLDRYTKDSQQAKRWYALAELMRDRWFSRRWVVQEISLALDRATVHCGGKIVHWSDFADAISLLASNQEVIKKLFNYSEWRDGPQTLGDVRSFGAHILLEATSNLFLTTTQGESEVVITNRIKGLESLVTSLKTFDATDRRDLIYSLVHIASDTQDNNFDVDYNKQAIDVYKDFTKFCIQSSGLLDIICRPWAMPIPGDPRRPSWIPLLSNSEFGEPDEVYSGRRNGDNLVGPIGNLHYKASRKTQYFVGPDEPQPQPQTSELDLLYNGESLRVKGFKLAKVKESSARNTGGVILRESLKMGSWEGIKKNHTRVPDKIWRTLVADRDPDGQPPPTWYQRACLRCLEIADTFNNGDLNVGELLQGQSEMLRKYLTRVRDVTWNRRFFTADTIKYPEKQEDPEKQGDPEKQEDPEKREDPEKQELFGLGPPETEKDDFVYILFGCSVPVVLREVKGSNDTMELIGEGYVYGKMEGEAIKEYQLAKTIRKKENIHKEEDIYYKERVFYLK